LPYGRNSGRLYSEPLSYENKEILKEVMAVTPTLMRQVWSIVESMQAATLLTLDDDSLIACLTDQVACSGPPLPLEERHALGGYLQSRIGLIRDLALGRCVA
jgi:hypothetical protein